MTSVARPAGTSTTPGRGDSVSGGSVAKPRARRPSPRRAEMLWALVFLAPVFLAILGLRIAPSIGAFLSSMYQGFPGGVREAEFAGFANYSDLFTTPAFLETL